MSKKRGQRSVIKPQNHMSAPAESMLDAMVDGREYHSIVGKNFKADLASELNRALGEISAIRNRPIACYVANMVNSKLTVSSAISDEDEMPFSEMLINAGASKEIDIVLITPGGSGQQVAKFVDKLRPRFDNLAFILPSAAMSAGTILVTSGDEIIMTSKSYIGPIDPQVLRRDGRGYVPAQAILTLIKRIQDDGQQMLDKGLQPIWSDLQILNQIDPNEIGFALSSSDYSVGLVKQFLVDYKFKTWDKTETNGNAVSREMKISRANEIARLLCDHSRWLSHSMGITREVAWNEIKLKITKSEDIPGLDRAVSRLSALLQYIFENTPLYKIYAMGDYMVFRQDPSLI